MKTLVRAVTALALLGVAAPALPCPAMKTTMAEAQPASGAKEKEKIAKNEKAKAKRQGTQTQKAAPTAAN